jgi:glucokinase
MAKILIGADIGGSHITCMAVNPADHRIMQDLCVRREIDCHADSEPILSGWSLALSELIERIGKADLSGIGFAMPGPFDYPAGIAWFKGVNKFETLYGINIREELRHRLDLPGTVPVRFINDASAFAIGEAWFGKAAVFSKSMAITLGTGFGSAFLKKGIPVITGDDVPNEGCVWHIPYGKSIANDYFSTPWFVERYFEMTGRMIAGVKELIEEESAVGSQQTAGSIHHPSSSIQHPASSIFQEFGMNLGYFLAPWLQMFGAECLVIGGNIANNFTLFEEDLLSGLAKGGCRIPVFDSELGELAAIAGAARICDDDFYSNFTQIIADE